MHHKTTRINDLDIFRRDAGLQDASAILLLHGFPTSSNMFRNLIPRLANSFRVIAPDYPGVGQSSMPDHKSYGYTFENFADVVDKLAEQLGVSKHSLHVLDYGAPVGYRLVASSGTGAGAHRAKVPLTFLKAFGYTKRPTGCICCMLKWCIATTRSHKLPQCPATCS